MNDEAAAHYVAIIDQVSIVYSNSHCSITYLLLVQNISIGKKYFD